MYNAYSQKIFIKQILPLQQVTKTARVFGGAKPIQFDADSLKV